MKIAYEIDGKVVAETFVTTPEKICFPHVVIDRDILEPIESWYIENGEVKIDQEKLKLFNRSRLPPLSRRQFNQTIRKFGLRSQIDTAVASIEDDDKREEIEIDLNDSDKFERMSESIKYMATLLELSDEKIDEMWLYAMGL